MFISEKFIFNNIPSDQYHVQLVYFENNVINDMKIPYSISLNMEGTNKSYPTYREGSEQPEKIVLNLAYVDKYGNLANMSENVFKNIKSWLTTDNFAPFVTEDYPDYILYLKCVGIQDKLTFSNQGFIEVTFQPYTHYFYKQFETDVLLNGTYILNIDNISKEICYPIITIEGTNENVSSVKINNLQVNNLELGEKIIIDNKMLTVLNGDKENKLKKCNRKWLKLIPGNNTIELIGNGKVNFKAEFPVIL